MWIVQLDMNAGLTTMTQVEPSDSKKTTTTTRSFSAAGRANNITESKIPHNTSLKMKFPNVVVAFLSASVAVSAFVPTPSRCSSLTHQHFMATVPEEEISESVAARAVKNVPDMKAYASAYKTVFNELPYKKLTPSEGKVPEDLLGTYFRCGPAMFSAGSIVPPKASIVQPKQPPVPDGQDPDRMVSHPFEGDGAVLGVTFSDAGDVTARYRYVRTPGFTNERKKGARLYKSMDSTREMGPAIAGGLGNDLPVPLFRHHLQPGLNKNRKNTSNTRAVYWGKRLLTLWEGGQPFKLDELALSTEGRSQLGGAIRRDTDPFGSRLAIDSKSNRAVGYGAELGQWKTEIALYEFDEKFRLVEGGRTYTDVSGLALLNDFCVTENYAVFIQPKLALNAMQFMVAKDPGKTLTAESGPAILHLIPRPGKKKTKLSIPIREESSFEGNFQFVNAYEERDEVIIDVIRTDGSSLKDAKVNRWPWGESLAAYQKSVSTKSLWRYTANLRNGIVKKHQLDDTYGFFGTISSSRSAQKHRYIYYNVGALGKEVAPLQGIAKFDCETSEKQVWFPSDAEFCGEPMFARKAGEESGAEDDGYLISVLYNGEKAESEIVVLNARNIVAGPVARLPLGMAVPHGLFGCFTDAQEARWQFDEIERRAKLADKMESKGNRWNEVKSDFSGLGLRFDDMEEYFGDFFS